MSSNHLHLIDPKTIQFSNTSTVDSISDITTTYLFNDQGLATYRINSVYPQQIRNNEHVKVQYSSTKPSSGDWIGAYSPANVDITETAPVKFGYCTTLNPDYLQSGSGMLQFNLTNLREDVKFYYFTSGLDSPIVMAESEQNVTFTNINEPLRNRVVATGNPNELDVMWSSATSTEPELRWGLVKGEYTYTVPASTKTIEKSDLCEGGAATGEGWRETGLIHTARMSGLVDLGLSNSDVYYIFGDVTSNDFSEEKVFHVPPLAGTQPPSRPTQVVLLADLGIGSTDGSYDTTVWQESCPPAANTSYSIGHRVQKGEVDAIFHSGDIAYANGYLSNWDFFMDLISPMAGGAIYLTTVGNHESDWPETDTLYSRYGSNGECGVMSTTLLPMPEPASTNKPWWSYDVGLIHFVGMSTEHNFSIGSEQYLWLEADLQKVNRSITPWVIFSGHRPMYVNSNFCCEWGEDDCTECVLGTDVEVMNTQRSNLEPLLNRYKVNLYFAGHYHNMQRHAAISNGGKVAQRAEYVFDELLGEYVYLHQEPNAPIYTIVGSAGNGPTYNSMMYDWSDKFWDNTFGYALVTALNSTALYWQLIDSSSDEVIDRVIITRKISIGDDDAASEDTSKDSQGIGEDQGWNSMSSLEQAMIIIISAVATIILFLLIAFFAYRYLKRCQQSSHHRGYGKSNIAIIKSSSRKRQNDDAMKLLSSSHGSDNGESSTHGPAIVSNPSAEIAMSTMV